MHNDPFFDWIRWGVAGFCDDANLSAMSAAVEAMPADGAVIEIGSFLGRSACFISRLIDLAGRHNRFFTVDDWYYEGYAPSQHYGGGLTSDRWRDFNERAFRLNIEYVATRRPHHFKLRSDTFFSAWHAGAERTDLFGDSVRLGGPIAFAYVDGDHSYAACRRDFENIDRDLAPGGFILFDDSAEGIHFESATVAAEASERVDYEIVGRFPNLLIRKR